MEEVTSVIGPLERDRAAAECLADRPRHEKALRLPRSVDEGQPRGDRPEGQVGRQHLKVMRCRGRGGAIGVARLLSGGLRHGAGAIGVFRDRSGPDDRLRPRVRLPSRLYEAENRGQHLLDASHRCLGGSSGCPCARSEVVYDIRPGLSDRPFEGFRLSRVAPDQGDALLKLRKSADIRLRTYHGEHRLVGGCAGACEVGTDEAGASCDKNPRHETPSGRMRGSGSGTIQRPPCASNSNICDLISSKKFQASTSR